MKLLDGYQIPSTYNFHPGHTWLSDEGRQNARVGMDSFAANLFGKIDAIEFAELNRWVRQGQKLCTVTRDGHSVDLLSPVEGVLVSVNHEVLKNPNLGNQRPLQRRLAMPDQSTGASDQRKEPAARLDCPSMDAKQHRARAAVVQHMNPALAQDGGLPVKGLLFQVDAEVQQQLTKEFFLT